MRQQTKRSATPCYRGCGSVLTTFYFRLSRTRSAVAPTLAEAHSNQGFWVTQNEALFKSGKTLHKRRGFDPWPIPSCPSSCLQGHGPPSVQATCWHVRFDGWIEGKSRDCASSSTRPATGDIPAQESQELIYEVGPRLKLRIGCSAIRLPVPFIPSKQRRDVLMRFLEMLRHSPPSRRDSLVASLLSMSR